jgi:hypothetical protein
MPIPGTEPDHQPNRKLDLNFYHPMKPTPANAEIRRPIPEGNSKPEPRRKARTRRPCSNGMHLTMVPDFGFRISDFMQQAVMRLARTVLCAAFWFTSYFCLLTSAFALLPEPDNILYGSITLDGQPVTASRTDIVVEARRLISGPAIASYRMGSSPQAGDFYTLRLAMESLSPLSDPNASLVGEGLFIVVTDSTGLRLQTGYSVAVPGTVQRLDFGAAVSDADGDGMPDAWETLVLGSTALGANSLTANGQTAFHNYVAGSNPNDSNTTFQVGVSTDNLQVQVSFFARRAQGIGYENRTRTYTLESAPNLDGGTWFTITGLTNILGNDQDVLYFETRTNSPLFYRARVALQ